MTPACLRASAGTISTPQFLDHFRRAWTESQRISGLRRSLIPRRLGLAVSGGADSMALAYLCKQLEKSGLVEDLSVTAFVVDHKAREESSVEARMVAGWLDELEIKTKILELDWSTGNGNGNGNANATGKGKPTAFETFARRLRFQALGTACRDNRIETLMMGHHQDDNVETTLWRLCTGARGAGLMGIPQVARIPECHGLYGVSESGDSFTLSGTGVSKGLISTGGISICRPLLSFPKAQLLATCHEHGIPFVNDPTNFDPTLTPRNAIRSLLSENRLPRALAPPSILSLIKASQDLLKDSIDLSNEILRHCKFLDLNIASGTMIIRFPSHPSSAQPADTIPPRRDTKDRDQRNRQIQAVTLRRITELISPFPENHFPLRSFVKFTEYTFPSPPSSLHALAPKRQPFTLGGVMFQPFQGNLTRYRDAYDATIHENNTWFLSRQPFMRHRLPTLQIDIPVSPSTINGNIIHHEQPHTNQHQRGRYEYAYTPWTLWDNRYWFRFVLTPTVLTETKDNNENIISLHQSTIPVTIRPLQQSDLQHFRNHLLSSHSLSATTSSGHEQANQNTKSSGKKPNPLWTQLNEALSRESPVQSRFTIPVLFIQQQQMSGIEEQLLALPTLDIRFPSSRSVSISIPHTGKTVLCEIHWEWMYKMMDKETVKSIAD